MQPRNAYCDTRRVVSDYFNSYHGRHAIQGVQEYPATEPHSPAPSEPERVVTEGTHDVYYFGPDHWIHEQLDEPMSKPNLTPLEAEEAHTAMQYMQARGLRFTHIKNEVGVKDERGKIKNFRAVMDWKDGVSGGFPDFVVILPGVGLLCPELKRKKGNKATAEQLEWIQALNQVPGVEARVCYGADELIEFIEQFYPLKRQISPQLPTRK